MFMSVRWGAAAWSCLPAMLAASSAVFAQGADPGGGTTLPEITVEGGAARTAPPTSGSAGPSPSAPPIVNRLQLPNTSASVTRQQIDATVNIVDTEDAVKYLPSLFVRKRDNGDTQPVLATRTWGVNSSARSLVYADDVLISALIANNNTIGAPRWGLVPPESIERVDFLYGPFSAAYPGNSIGGVLQITTRMPDHAEASIKQTEAFQTFRLYGTHDTFRSDQTSVTVGDRANDLSWLFNMNYLNSFAQPLTLVTNGPAPAGTSGTFNALNKTGQAANVVGAGGLTHSEQVSTNLKVALDITSWLRATYTFGFWSNSGAAAVQTYLRNAAGAPTFGNVSGFASNRFGFDAQHIANSLSLKTDTHGLFDWEAIVSNYTILNDQQRNPYGVLSGTNFTSYGKVARLDGTNWTNLDLKGIWRPFGIGGEHEVSFGLHGDQYRLANPTVATSDWLNGGSFGPRYADGRGTTETGALWIQDAWHFAPAWTLTLGGRLENWQASDGFNLATTANAAGAITGTSATRQPEQSATRFSPKATLAWAPDETWLLKASFGESYRFPTVAELYQVVQTGTIFVVPNPNLRPEQDFSGEFTLEKRLEDTRLRATFFQENTNGALIAQTNFVTGVAPTTFVTNVDAIRNRGVELEAARQNVFVDRFDVSGSVTYVDSRILRDAGFASTTGTTARGKRVPYVPDWRVTLVGTYRFDEHWSWTVAARYSGKQYSTLDNTDIIPRVYGAFDKFLVVDTRIRCDTGGMASISFGIDNIGNEKYFLFHPFPGRTYLADARVRF